MSATWGEAWILQAMERKRETKRLRERCSEEQAHRCCYCGVRCPGRATLEHIIPKSKGGQTIYANCVMACEICNGKRGVTDALEYFAALQASRAQWKRALRVLERERAA